MNGVEKISSEIERKELRKNILDFEELLNRHENVVHGDSDLCPLKHSFTDGIYVREIRIPAGAVLTGKIHKHRHPNFLMSGIVEVVTENGGVERLEGPMFMISEAGTKRALHAVTDLWWCTIHENASNTTDLKKIEEFVIAKDYEEFERFRKLQGNRVVKFLDRIKRMLL